MPRVLIVVLAAILATALWIALRTENDQPLTPGDDAAAGAPRAAVATAASATNTAASAAPADGATERVTVPSNIGVFAGRVLRRDERTPVAGVAVRPRLPADHVLAGPDHVVTDDLGNYEIRLTESVTIYGVTVEAGDDTAMARRWFRTRARLGQRVERDILVDPAATLRGTVVDTRGLPLGNATVLGWNDHDRHYGIGPADRKATTDATGHFELAGMGVDFTLTATRRGMACTGRLRGGTRGRKTVGDLVLVLDTATSIRGRVFAPHRVPLQNAEVTVDVPAVATDRVVAIPHVDRAKADGARGQTDRDGRFVLGPLARKSCRVTVVHRDYPKWSGVLEPGTREHEIVLNAGLSIRGRVFDAAGRAAAGAKIRVHADGGKTTVADARGEFLLTGLAADDDAALIVLYPGHAVLVETRIFKQNEGSWSIQLALEQELGGRVVDGAGNPVADAAIHIEGNRVADLDVIFTEPATWEWLARTHETRSDADGRFELHHVYDGAFTVAATHPTEPKLRTTVRTHSGVRNLELRLDPASNTGVTFAGTVADAFTGEPLTHYRLIPMVVRPSGASGSHHEIAAREGAFELGGLDECEMYLVAQAHGYARWQSAPQDFHRGVHQFDIRLRPRRDLQVELVDQNNHPIGDAHVTVFDEQGAALTIERSGWSSNDIDTNAAGTAALSGMPAGMLRLVIEVPGQTQKFEHTLDARSAADGPIRIPLVMR